MRSEGVIPEPGALPRVRDLARIATTAKDQTAPLPIGGIHRSVVFAYFQLERPSCAEADGSLVCQDGLAMPEALDHMVVHHAHGLHKRVADGRSYKIEASILQRFAHGIRLRSPRRNLTP